MMSWHRANPSSAPIAQGPISTNFDIINNVIDRAW